jgi:hypothetical protein
LVHPITKATPAMQNEASCIDPNDKKSSCAAQKNICFKDPD